MAEHWVENHRRDSWRRQAKAGGYRARSAFKLKQIQQRFELLREGDVVLDVGCGDGRVLVAASRLTGCRGVGVDVSPQCVEAARAMARLEEQQLRILSLLEAKLK